MRLIKKIATYALAFGLAFSSVPMRANVSAQTEGSKDHVSEGISLGSISWTDDEYTDYKFTGSSVSSGTYKNLLVSVDNGGTFTIGTMSFSSTVEATGIEKDGAYVNAATTASELRYLTIKGSFTANEIKSFIAGLTFHRNTENESEIQEVSILANSVGLEAKDAVLLLDGKAHYYRYVDTASEENRDWYSAYEAAKATSIGQMKGYLATLTSDMENDFVYRYFCDKYNVAQWEAIRSWVGGAKINKTASNTALLDKDSFSKSLFDSDARYMQALNNGGTYNALNDMWVAYNWGTWKDWYMDPITKELKTETSEEVIKPSPRTWYWVCGPEAGQSFYLTNLKGTYEKAKGSDGCDIEFNSWGSERPDNANGADMVLEYGTSTDHKGLMWDDYAPDYDKAINYNDGISGYIVEWSPYGDVSETSKRVSRYVTADEHDYNEEDLPGTERSVTITASDFSIEVGSGFVNTDKVMELASVSAVDDKGVEAEVEVNTDDLLTLNERILYGPAGIISLRLTSENASKTISVTVEADDNTNISLTVYDPIGSSTPLISGPDKDVEEKNLYNITVPKEETALTIVAELEKESSSFATTYGTKGVKYTDIPEGVEASSINPGLINIKNLKDGENGSISIKVHASDGSSKIYEFAIKKEASEVVEPVDVTLETTTNSFSVKSGEEYITADDIIKTTGAKAYVTDNPSKKVDVSVNAEELLALNEKIFNAIPGNNGVTLSAGDKTKTITVSVIADDNTDASVKASDPEGNYNDKIKVAESLNAGEGKRVFDITVPYDETSVSILVIPEKKTSSFDQSYGLKKSLKGNATASSPEAGKIVVSNLAVGENGSVSVEVKAQNGATKIYEFNIIRDLCDNAVITAKNFSVPFGSGFLNSVAVIEKAEIVAKDKKGKVLDVSVDTEGLLALNQRIVEGPSGTVSLKITAGKTTSLVKVTILPDDSTDASVSVSDPNKEYTPILMVKEDVDEKKIFGIKLPYEETSVAINTTLTDSTSSFKTEHGTGGVEKALDESCKINYKAPSSVTVSDIPEGEAGYVSVCVVAESGVEMIYEYVIEREAAPVIIIPEEEKEVTIEADGFLVKAGSDYLRADDIIEKSGATAKDEDEEPVDVTVDVDDLLSLNEKITKGEAGSYELTLKAGKATKKITVSVVAVGNTNITVSVADTVAGSTNVPECSEPVKTKTGSKLYNITVPYYETGVKISVACESELAAIDSEYGVKTDNLHTGVRAMISNGVITVTGLSVGDNGRISIKVNVTDDESAYMIYEFSFTRGECTDAIITASDFEVPSFTDFLKEDDVITKGRISAEDKKGQALNVSIDNADLLALNERIINGPAGKVSLKVKAGNTTKSFYVTVLPDSNTDASISVSDPNEEYVPKITATDKTTEGKIAYTIFLPADEEELSIKTVLAKETSGFDSEYGINSTGLVGDISLNNASTPADIRLSDINAENNGKLSVKVKAADNSSMIYEFVITKAKKSEEIPVEEAIISIEASDFTVDAGTDMLFSTDFAKLANIAATDDSGNEVSYEIDADDLINLNKEISDRATRTDRTVDVNITSGKAAKKVTVTVNPADLDPDPDMEYAISDADGLLTDKITHTLREEDGQWTINITVPYDVKSVKIANVVTELGAELDTTYGVKTSELKAGAKVLAGSVPSNITVKDLEVGDNGYVSVKVKTLKDKTRIYRFSIVRDLCDNAVITAKNFSVPFGSAFLNAETVSEKANISAKDKDGKALSVTVDSESLLTLNERILKGPSGTVSVKLTAGKTISVLKVTILPDDSTDASVSASDPGKTYTPILAEEKESAPGKKTYSVKLPYEEDSVLINTTLSDTTSSFDRTYGNKGVYTDLSEGASAEYTAPTSVKISSVPEGEENTISVRVVAENGDAMIYEYVIEREKAPEIEEPEKEVVVTITAGNFHVTAGGEYLRATDVLKKASASAKTDENEAVDITVNADDLLGLNEMITKEKAGTANVTLTAGKTTKIIVVTVDPASNTNISVAVSDPDVATNEPVLSGPVRTKQGAKLYSVSVPYYETGVKLDITCAHQATVISSEYGIKTENLKNEATATKVAEGSYVVTKLSVGNNGKIAIKVVAADNTEQIYEFEITREACDDAAIISSDFEVRAFSDFLKEADVLEMGNISATDSEGTKLTVTVDNSDLLTLNERIVNGPAGKVSIKLHAGATTSTVNVTVLPDDNTDASITVSDPEEKYVPRVTETDKSVDGKTVYTILLPEDERKLSIKNVLKEQSSHFDTNYGNDGIDSSKLSAEVVMTETSTPSDIELSEIASTENGSVSVKVIAADGSSMIYEFNITQSEKAAIVPEENAVINIEAEDFSVEAGSGMLFSSDFAKLAQIKATDDSGDKVTYEVDADDLISLNNEIKDADNKEEREVTVKVTSGKTTKNVNVKILPKKEEGEQGGDTPGGETETEVKKVITITASDFEVELGSTTLTSEDVIKRSNASASDQDGKAVSVSIDLLELVMLNKYIDGDKEKDYPLKLVAGDQEKTITVKLVAKKAETPSGEDPKTTTSDSDQPTSETPTDKKEDTTVVKEENQSFDIVLSKTLAVKDTYSLTFAGTTKKTKITYKSSKKKVATVSNKGVVTAKKTGTAVITAVITQSGSTYKVKLTVKVVKTTSKLNKLLSIKKKALIKKTGALPELNVYEAVGAGKTIKLKLTNIQADAKLECVINDKKEKKIVSIGKIKQNKKKKTATIPVKGLKRGFAHVTLKVNQGGRFYYVRYLIRVKSGKWTLKQLKKYLK